MYVDPEKADELGSTYNFIDPSLYNFIALNSYQVLLTALLIRSIANEHRSLTVIPNQLAISARRSTSFTSTRWFANPLSAFGLNDM